MSRLPGRDRGAPMRMSPDADGPHRVIFHPTVAALDQVDRLKVPS